MGEEHDCWASLERQRQPSHSFFFVFFSPLSLSPSPLVSLVFLINLDTHKKQGVDFIECDAVYTKDCALVCRHDVDLTRSTDAALKFPEKVRRGGGGGGGGESPAAQAAAPSSSTASPSRTQCSPRT